MRITSEIPSVSHPGYVHQPGTEATLSLHPTGHFRLLELTVPPSSEGADDGWTEQFQLPRGMKVDPTKPVVMLGQNPWAVGQGGQRGMLGAELLTRTANFVVDQEGRIVGVGIAMDDGRFEVFRLGAGFVDESGVLVKT